jgi:hypothetical protein
MNKPSEYRVITWTKRNGINSVSEVMSQSEAIALCKLLREANPVWLHVEVEPA